MAFSTTASSTLLLLIAAAVAAAVVEAQSINHDTTSSATAAAQDSWPFGFESHYHNVESVGEEEEEADQEGQNHYVSLREEDSFADPTATSARRSLFWYKMRYYISYGALSANRIPCPPRSGRSYYTHDCYRARGPVHPYYRGCSTITHCRR